MKIFRLLVLLAALALALAVAGCGGGDDEVPSDAVAVVDGDEIARTEYDALLEQAKKGYKNRKQEFPAAGSAEFQTLKNQAVQYLVQRVQFSQKAEDFGIEVTEKQVDAAPREDQEAVLQRRPEEVREAAQGAGSDRGAGARATSAASSISEKIFAKVTGDVKVTDEQIKKFYEEKKATQYSQPESRDVRHILVKTKAKADELEAQLKDGADFGALAKKFSEDTGSKATGGKLTISKGQTVAEFDKEAFSLKKNEISEPVKTQFGFHIIQALSDVKPAKVTPLKEVRAAIEGELEQTKKNEKMTAWIEDLKKEYKGKITLRRRLQPPARGRRRRARPAGPPLPAGKWRSRCRDRVGNLGEALVELQELTRRLRRDCPWDREQTALTIVPHTVEEAYEVADAAAADPADPAKLLDELGDLLFQVYFLALLLSEEGHGDLEAVARNVHAKLVRRHPHVFGDAEAATAGRVRDRWEEIKSEQEGRAGIFHDVPASLPALVQARKLQRRAVAAGFDWPDLEGPLAKVREELGELEAEVAQCRASRHPRPSRTRQSCTRSATSSSRSSTSRAG